MPTNRVIRNPETREDVIIIKEDKKTIIYKISKESRQYQNTRRITFKGFTKVPPGFWKSGDYAGYGFTGQGYRLLKFFSKSLDKRYDLIIHDKQSNIKELKTKYNVTLNHRELQLLLRHLNQISRDKYYELELTVSSYLYRLFPSHIPKPSTTIASIGEYKKGELSKVLNKSDILDNLSKDDKDELKKFYPDFLKHHTRSLATRRKLLALAKTKHETQTVYIENIISEYTKKREKNPTEPKWQEFLKDYILLFNLNYTDIIEKTNISVVKGKIPDFMLIDAYNYLDIFEIKRPSTRLMEFDKSRSNFFWSKDLSKAIAQTESYIYNVSKNADTIKDDIKTYNNIDVRVIKPRGYIIAGETNQLKKKYYKTKVDKEDWKKLTDLQVRDGFRLLNESLRNVTVIFYDELINNLQAFLSRIKK